MKVIHVVGTISLESSGPSHSVPALCRGLAENGVEVELHYIDYGGQPEVQGVLTVPQPRVRNRWLDSAAWNGPLLRALWRAAQPGTILHAHGLWHFPAIFPGWVGSLKGVPWVISPRGTLGAWLLDRARLRKRLSLATGQAHALHRAALLHATSESEADDFRAFGLKGRISTIPNAIQPPSLSQLPMAESQSHRDVLFLSRIHPKKAPERLLLGWKEVAADFPQTSLILAGPSEEGCREDLERLVQSQAIPRVQFPGELRGDHKWEALAAAQVLVLPSHHENFGMVVAEALSVGTPVIASRGTPWASLEAREAGWWVDNTVESIAAALREALCLPATRREAMGRGGRTLVEEAFSPRATGALMAAEYERILKDRRS